MDLLSSIMAMMGHSQTQPQVVAQDRYMRTPIVQQQQNPGVGANYDAGNDRISVGDLNSLPTGILAHEITHRIYNKAGLKKMAPELLPSLAKSTHDYLSQSPLYNQMQGAGSPEQMTDEGLAYSATSPVMGDKDFVTKAASMIQNPSLKDTLMRIFTNRQNSKVID